MADLDADHRKSVVKAMSRPTRMPCPAACKDGLVPHTKRLLGGEPDPTDMQEHDLCPVCDGAGTVPFSGKLEEKQPAPQ